MLPQPVKSLLPFLLCWCIITPGESSNRAAPHYVARDSYGILARAIQSRVSSDKNEDIDLPRIVKALKSLSATQKTFKGLDGAAHEAYQRTHDSTDVHLGVAGRALRSAARVGATATALGACELCELVSLPDELMAEESFEESGTLVGRKVLLNITDITRLGSSPIKCLVLFQSDFNGPCGLSYGKIDPAEVRKKPKGKLLIILGDNVGMEEMFELLEREPRHVRLSRGPEAASIQPALHDGASEIVRRLEPILRKYNETAIHFSGHSMAGGLASISAAILNGEIPLAKESSRRRKRRKEDRTNTTNIRPLQGLCRDVTSAVALGAPPCFSPNVEAHYVTSIMYGDDIVCRTSPPSFERFIDRAKRALKRGGLIGKKLNFVADATSLAMVNLKSHVVGSEGEEAMLSISGKAYLVRPRRVGGTCSIHEIGNQLKGGREALRAAVLWQLNDILLSRSLWRHHSLESYIRGLDRIQLRGVADDPET